MKKNRKKTTVKKKKEIVFITFRASWKYGVDFCSDSTKATMSKTASAPA